MTGKPLRSMIAIGKYRTFRFPCRTGIEKGFPSVEGPMQFFQPYDALTKRFPRRYRLTSLGRDVGWWSDEVGLFPQHAGEG